MKPEILFGTSSISACLSSNRRKAIKLLYSKDIDNPVIQKARIRNIPIQKVSSVHLDTLTQGRPHQNLVLNVGPLKLDKIISVNDTDFQLSLKETRPINSRRKYPIILALDQIVDPQNLGAILRSAFFFDIDGIVLTETETAPLSSNVSKASSGALELLENFFIVSNLAKFLVNSRMNGYHVYGTDIASSNVSTLPITVSSPSILVMGNEGRGLRSVVSKACDSHLLIQKQNGDKEGIVDSLNVAVAASILIHSLTRSF